MGGGDNETKPIAGLRSIDPRQVPLPHGTQVTTTVAQPIAGSDRIIPQGVVGRVIEHLGDGRVKLQVVGRGEVVYRRIDVVPRKEGELAFAVRRAWAEANLRPCTVLEATVGSRAWGLSSDTSDTDVRGVFVLPATWRYGLVQPPETIISADGNCTLWEVEKMIGQALRADPNTLETLFVSEVRVVDEMGQWLLDARDAFVSREIYGSFGRYALAQAKKLRQSHRLAQHRVLVLDWLREDPDTDLDRLAVRLAAEALDEGEAGKQRAKQHIKQLYRSLFDQGLLEANSLEAFAAFARGESADLELPRELRPKNAYNLLRIVSCAVDWLRTGTPALVADGALRDRLLQIKNGDVALDVALDWTEEVARELHAAREDCPLPSVPDFDRADAVLRRVRSEAARRFHDGAAGPWGSDAPPPPLPSEHST